MKLCKDCVYYHADKMCYHPQALDLVTGDPADAHMQRYGQELEGEPPICGVEGQWWEAIPADPKE